MTRIGVRDDFFQLGGHSLLAARMFARIAEKLRKNMPLATLFRGATIEKLAQVIRAEGWTSHWSVLVPIQEHGSKPPLFLVHGLYGNVVEFLWIAAPYTGRSASVWRSGDGLDSGRAAFVSIPEMAEHYIKEIRSVQPMGPIFWVASPPAGWSRMRWPGNWSRLENASSSWPCSIPMSRRPGDIG